MSREEFVRLFATNTADPGLAADLRELAPDTTDDLDDPGWTGSPTRASFWQLSGV
jgi:hypothetical protein